MDRLPPEIILNICESLACCSPKWWITTVNLKALRLTSRAFAGPAAEFLFSEILVFMNNASLSNLRAVAEHPVYRSRVYSVNVFGRMISDELNKRDYVENVREMVFTGPESRGWGFNDQGNRFLSRRDVEEGYEQYQRALKEEEEAYETAALKLAEAFKAFEHLSSVRSQCSDFGLDDEGVVQLQPARIHDMARKMLAPWGLVWVGMPYPADNAKLLCEAISRSGCYLDELFLGASRYPFESDLLMTSGNASEHLVKALRCSRSVILSLGGSPDNWQVDDNFDESYPTGGFFADAPVLEELVLQGSDWFLVQMNSTFPGTVNWPHLKTLNFYSFVVTEARLRSLLRSVRSTLTELYLENGVLLEGSWYNIFKEMQAFTFSRENLELCRLFSVGTLRAGTEPPSIEKYEALIKDFVCDGKEWSYDLPEWLSAEVP